MTNKSEKNAIKQLELIRKGNNSNYKFLYWDEYDKEKKENTSTNKGKSRKKKSK